VGVAVSFGDKTSFLQALWVFRGNLQRLLGALIPFFFEVFFTHFSLVLIPFCKVVPLLLMDRVILVLLMVAVTSFSNYTS